MFEDDGSIGIGEAAGAATADEDAVACISCDAIDKQGG